MNGLVEAVLDASAVLAVLKREPGATKVEAVLSVAVVGAINLAEVVGVYARDGGREADIREMIRTLQLVGVPADDALAYEIGMMLPMTRPAGLSLGDRACLALARRFNARALTAERSWLAVAPSLGVQVELIR